MLIVSFMLASGLGGGTPVDGLNSQRFKGLAWRWLYEEIIVPTRTCLLNSNAVEKGSIKVRLNRRGQVGLTIVGVNSTELIDCINAVALPNAAYVADDEQVELSEGWPRSEHLDYVVARPHLSPGERCDSDEKCGGGQFCLMSHSVAVALDGGQRAIRGRCVDLQRWLAAKGERP